jgi:polyphenol oxidase
VWQRADTLQFIHGFADRLGGSSTGSFQGLNLSVRVGDDTAIVQHNREIALAALGLENARVAMLRQIHSNQVITVGTELPNIPPEADALVTNQANTVLVIETADCYPVLLEDANAGVVAAAHCGWRGTAGRILEHTVSAMQKLGATPGNIRAAIGPGICAAQYPVRFDVIEKFLEAGFPEEQFMDAQSVSDSGSRLFHLDLAKANAWLLESIGVHDVWTSGKCSTDPQFFSYRRDQGQTGRMWSVIAMLEERGKRKEESM